jgi:hypothetical protein
MPRYSNYRAPKMTYHAILRHPRGWLEADRARMTDLGLVVLIKTPELISFESLIGRAFR